MKNKAISIVKMSGEKAVFDADKLRRSLERSGARDTVIQQIVDEVEATLSEGDSTKEIYKKAFRLLRKSSRHTAARYKLKKAIMELGPSGFPFERFVGEILDYQGFNTQIGKIIEGHCVSHEVDVFAQKADKYLIVECKFHSSQGRYCDVKTPLYIHSRFMDIQKELRKSDGQSTKKYTGSIFTNTRFSSDAIEYGNCAGLLLVGWDYPKQGSLKERIDISGLHPVTCLTTLTTHEKQKLLKNGTVMCRDLLTHPESLEAAAIPLKRHKNILKEADDLCAI